MRAGTAHCARTTQSDSTRSTSGPTGDADLDELLPLLRCRDEETRDTVAYAISCGIESLKPAIHERAESFLAFSNEPHDCTQEHLWELLGRVVRAYPEEWTPALAVLSRDDDPLVREMAVWLLGSVADAYPAVAVEYRDAIGARLDDDGAVRVAAFFALDWLAESHPDAGVDYVPEARTAFEDDAPAGTWGQSPRTAALQFLESLATLAPESVLPAAGETVDLVASLAGPGMIEDRARRDRTGTCTDAGEPDRTLNATLSLCATLARTHPDAVADARAPAERVLDGRYYGRKEALRLLVELKR